MKILITESTCSLGNRIVYHAKERGHDVRVLCSTLPLEDKRNSCVEYVRGNRSDVPSLINSMQGCDSLIHSTGFDFNCQKNALCNPYLDGAKNILQSASQCGIKRIVLTFPLVVLGPTSEKPANEDKQNHSQAGYSPSNITQQLYETDQWVCNWNQQDCSVNTVYPGKMYGPGIDIQHSIINRIMDNYIHRRLYGIPGSGKFRLTFSYIEDVAKGHVLALENGKPGGHYILGGEDATLIEFFNILHSVTQLKPPGMKIPLSVLKMYEGMEQLKALMLRKYVPKLTPEMMNYYQYHWRYSSQKAIAEIGYSRTPLKIGIIKTLESLQFNFPSERDQIL